MHATQLDHATARAAIALANLAPSVHNSQPWRWRVTPDAIHLFADPDRVLAATDPEGRDVRLSCGAALHHLRLALGEAGIDTVVHRMPDPREPAHLAVLEPTPGRPSPRDHALARAMRERRSDRRTFSTWPVPPEFLREVGAAADAQGTGWVLLEGTQTRRRVANLVRHAGVAQALTPGTARENAAWTGRPRGAPDGVPSANVPDQRDGVVPVRDFRGAEQAPNELGHGESDGTVLGALCTPTDEPADQLRAGEALSAVLLTATRYGLATDPISQPLEVPATRAALRDLLPGAGEPQVLVRLGWAPMSAGPVPATGRRPPADTIDRADGRDAPDPQAPADQPPSDRP